MREDDQAVMINQKIIQKEHEENQVDKRKMNTINLEQALNEAENKLELDVDPELRK